LKSQINLKQRDINNPSVSAIPKYPQLIEAATRYFKGNNVSRKSVNNSLLDSYAALESAINIKNISETMGFTHSLDSEIMREKSTLNKTNKQTIITNNPLNNLFQTSELRLNQSSFDNSTKHLLDESLKNIQETKPKFKNLFETNEPLKPANINDKQSLYHNDENYSTLKSLTAQKFIAIKHQQLLTRFNEEISAGVKSPDDIMNVYSKYTGEYLKANSNNESFIDAPEKSIMTQPPQKSFQGAFIEASDTLLLLKNSQYINKEPDLNALSGQSIEMSGAINQDLYFKKEFLTHVKSEISENNSELFSLNKDKHRKTDLSDSLKLPEKDSSNLMLQVFTSQIRPESMTKEEILDIFQKFTREISINDHNSWNKFYEILNNNIENSFQPDNTLDIAHRNLLINFEQAILPKTMTREEIMDLFLRYSREVSNSYPEAWKQLNQLLIDKLPGAFSPDNTIDEAHKNLLINFDQAIAPDSMTKEEIMHMYIQFARDISNSYPEAWKLLDLQLQNELPYAFEPDTTMDHDTRELISQFKTLIDSQYLNSSQLNTIFADYLVQVPLRFTEAKKILELDTLNKLNQSEHKDKQENYDKIQSRILKKEHQQITDNAKLLNDQARKLGDEIKLETNRDQIGEKERQIKGIQEDKKSLDALYRSSIVNINGNHNATQSIMDDYIHELSLSFDKKDTKELFDFESEELTDWDMLRTLRREDLLDNLNELPKEKLVEHLYVVPKFTLKRVLTQLPEEDMCRVLFNARYPEALLRAMPRKKAIELLPAPHEMLPILMNFKEINGFKTGCDLIEEVVTKGMNVEGEQNSTRTEEELLPYMLEQLTGKTPRNSDAIHPVQGKINPVEKEIKHVQQKQTEQVINIEMTANALNNNDDKNQLDYKYQLPESLQSFELMQLALNKIDQLSKTERKETLAAKRGDPVNIVLFLEEMKKVKDMPGAKSAVSVLSNTEANSVMRATLPILETKHLVKIAQAFRGDSKELVKEMPGYVITGLIKDLPKYHMQQGFKLLDKDLIIGMFKTLPTQTIAKVSSDLLDRNNVKDIAYKKKFSGT
jgi:hypothetical protein